MHVLGREAHQCLAQALLVCLCGLLFSISVCGLDRDRTLRQFYHTAWTAKDGAPSQITSLTQTQDGYLWIGSGLGLFRFDGLQFEPYEPPGITLPSHNINSLMAMPEGGLWISFNPSGLAFLKDGATSIFHLPEELPLSEVVCFARDFDGRVWAGAHTGLALFDGSRWVNTASYSHFSSGRIWAMFVDRDGTLWVAVDNTIVFLQRGSGKFQETGVHTNGIAQIGQAKDGRLWMTDWSRPIQPIPLPSRDFVPADPKIGIHAYKFLFDREGSLWLTEGGADGIRRVRFPERLGNRKLQANDPELESFTAHDGLTENSANTFFEDREGNIWISSNKGLDRFRHSHMVPVILPSGHRDFTLLAGDAGEIWVGSASLKPLLRIRGENILTGSHVPTEVSSVGHDSNGVVWWGAHGGMWRQHGEVFKYFHEPKIANRDWFWEVIPSDSDGALWAGVGDVGVFYFKDQNWTTRPKPEGLLDRVPSASYRDPTGRIWFGYTDNRIYTLEGEHVQAYSHDDGIDVGRIRVIRGRGPIFWVGGELGLAVFSNGRFKTIHKSGGEPFGTVSGIVETPDGALWLNNLHGVVRISPEDVRQIALNPDYAVTCQTFGFLDGLPGAPQMGIRSSTAIEATDGRLWFATDSGLAWIDPTQISKNMVPPPVSIRSVDTNIKKYEPSVALKLPAGTQGLRIEYAALSLSVPERVNFRYKLEGADKDWQNVSTRRQAFYTNLGPGDYVFRVIASNNDGIWNDQGATLVFSIAPAWYQTNLFLVLCVFAGLLAIWTIYRLRVRQIARHITTRFDERLEERTLLARELHDTFLQTIQGSKMVADDALEHPDDSESLRTAMERLSGWLGQATQEGRAVLHSLRASTIEGNDLAEGLRHAAEVELIPDSMAITFSVVGDSRELRPIACNEIYRIGYEAIRNAIKHSRATRVEVELTYSHDITVQVRDNGMGIDRPVQDKGKEKHFGLQGMRERATRIGGKLTINSSAIAGTEITVVVPGSIVFQEAKLTTRQSVKAVLQKTFLPKKH